MHCVFTLETQKKTGWRPWNVAKAVLGLFLQYLNYTVTETFNSGVSLESSPHWRQFDIMCAENVLECSVWHVLEYAGVAMLSSHTLSEWAQELVLSARHAVAPILPEKLFCTWGRFDRRLRVH
ncbi:unnamed protein product [Ostreobium quekettii]|uniref:Uncharacterized protein n=1 Tax=Ostreobium quekettii TaxID=121088 RepID=A0A8S1JF35_9CHLO|nr:unnamed protein product [Ostreobium quekettii]